MYTKNIIKLYVHTGIILPAKTIKQNVSMGKSLRVIPQTRCSAVSIKKCRYPETEKTSRSSSKFSAEENCVPFCYYAKSSGNSLPTGYSRTVGKQLPLLVA
jgi:hypothetical protein